MLLTAVQREQQQSGHVEVRAATTWLKDAPGQRPLQWCHANGWHALWHSGRAAAPAATQGQEQKQQAHQQSRGSCLVGYSQTAHTVWMAAGEPAVLGDEALHTCVNFDLLLLLLLLQ
jgi:hypothetical protein